MPTFPISFVSLSTSKMLILEKYLTKSQLIVGITTILINLKEVVSTAQAATFVLVLCFPPRQFRVSECPPVTKYLVCKVSTKYFYSCLQLSASCLRGECTTAVSNKPWG